MTIKLGWKIMRISDKGELLSLRQGLGARKYSASKWTMPRRNCGPLAVFDTKEHACRFVVQYCLYDSRGLKLCRCKYVPSGETRLWVPRIAPSGELASLTEKFLIGMPRGTVFASKVRLIARGV